MKPIMITLDYDELTSQLTEAKNRLDDALSRERISVKLFEEKKKEVQMLTILLKDVVRVWELPISEQCKPYAERMYDVVHRIKETLKIESS
jgi:hypothetical protein